jgi:predicted nucleic acid-binding protein
LQAIELVCDAPFSFVDYSSDVLTDDYEIERIFTFASDDFHTEGVIVVPADTGDT